MTERYKHATQCAYASVTFFIPEACIPRLRIG